MQTLHQGCQGSDISTGDAGVPRDSVNVSAHRTCYHAPCNTSLGVCEQSARYGDGRLWNLTPGSHLGEGLRRCGMLNDYPTGYPQDVADDTLGCSDLEPGVHSSNNQVAAGPKGTEFRQHGHILRCPQGRSMHSATTSADIFYDGGVS